MHQPPSRPDDPVYISAYLIMCVILYSPLTTIFVRESQVHAQGNSHVLAPGFFVHKVRRFTYAVRGCKISVCDTS